MGEGAQALSSMGSAAYALVSFPAPSPHAGKGLVNFKSFLGFADSACHMTNQACTAALNLSLVPRL